MTDATFLVCEDGQEYSERFSRLFGARFAFARASHLAEALPLARAGVAGLLFDLDFRRTPAALLIDEHGATGERPASEARRLAAQQGILLLRALRAHGIHTPALLFADLDDPGQASFLQSSLAPLTIIPSTAALPVLAHALAELAAR